LRIGDVSAQTGISVPTLRAWERRYGLLTPARTDGGHRLYAQADVARVRRVQALVDRGWTVAAAAEEARTAPDAPAPAPAGSNLDSLRQDLLDGARAFDGDAMHTVFDAAVERAAMRAVVERVLVPAFEEIGTWWKDDPGAVANEHVATQVVRGRLLSLLRARRYEGGPRCLAVCPPGESHDLGLLMASVLVAEKGWTVTFLGASTPVAAIEAAIARVAPQAAIAAAYTRPTANRMMQYRASAPGRVVLGGPGFKPSDVELGGEGFSLAATIPDAADLLDPRVRRLGAPA
jgi:DNA-binding transcriptional MerR regulator